MTSSWSMHIACHSNYKVHAQIQGLVDLQDRISQDSSLRAFLEHVDGITLQGYAMFLVQLTCQCSPAESWARALIRWITGGTTLLSTAPRPVALTQLAAVAGAQSGRLRACARLLTLLDKDFGKDVPAELLSQEVGDARAVDIQRAAQLARQWRDDAEEIIQRTLVQDCMRALHPWQPHRASGFLETISRGPHLLTVERESISNHPTLQVVTPTYAL